MTRQPTCTGRLRRRRRAAALAAWALVLVSLMATAPASAHTRSVSYAIWTIAGERATVRLELSELDRTVIQGTTAAREPLAWQAHLQQAVRMFDDEGACEPQPSSFASQLAPAGRLQLTWQVQCARPDGQRRVRSDLLFDAAPSHVQLATVRFVGQPQSLDLVLTGAEREATVEGSGRQTGSAWTAATQYLTLGVEHILTGWDHLVFLTVLLLLARSLRQVAVAVTGFTIGHSVTLSLAVLGYARPDVQVVEALIGLSIVIVAAENVWMLGETRGKALPIATTVAIGLSAITAALWRPELGLAVAGVGLFTACSFGLLGKLSRPDRVRWAVAALFGLIHGFGFAGALERLAPSKSQLAVSLFSFNVGVELGQLCCVALLWPLFLLLRRRGLERHVVQWGSAIAAALGTFWFVTRALS